MSKENSPKKVVKPVRNAHDKGFRKAMRNPTVARDMLSHHLPAEILSAIDLDTLKTEDGVFIDLQLLESGSDVLYSVEWKEKTPENKNARVFIYALVEQQRRAERFMPFRMIQYTCKIIDSHLANHKAKVLPIVIPVVVFNGEKTYPYPVKVFDLFGDKKVLAEKFMFNQFHLVDLTTISDEQLRQHRWSGILEMLLKNIARRDMVQYLQSLTEDFNRLLAEGLKDYVLTMLKYLIEKAEIEDKTQFFNWIHQKLTSNPVETEAMTIAEQLRAEGYESGVLFGRQQGMQQGMRQGMQQGIQQGMQQGLERGTLEGERTVIIRLLKHRFGYLPPEKLKKMEDADAQTLLLLGEKILDAKSLSDIFGE